jgi:hypothetical protein
MISANQIRQLLLTYLTDSDADKLVSDFAVLSHDVHRKGDPKALELANKIEFKLAALHSGLISRSEFKAALLEATRENVYALDLSVSTAASISSTFSAHLNWGPAVTQSACTQHA